MSTIGRKRVLDNVVEDTSSCEPPKVAKFTGPIAYRKNIVKLAKDKPEEFKRFCIAIARMQRNSERGGDPKNDWWNLCALHAGPFRYEVESSMRPAYRQYLEYYGPVQQKDETADRDWQTTGFCAHDIPTFLAWHRPYMKAFEIALQYHDPRPDPNNPLALHYWEWDSAQSHALPKIFTDEKIKDFNDNDIDNPLLLGPTGFTSLKNVPYTEREEYEGVPDIYLDSGYHAFEVVKDYSKVCTANGNHYNLETPHNQLHNAVGGDMGNVGASAFDPIFWLHHSNVERMHCAWIRKHGIPTEVVGFHRGKPDHNYIDAPLFPYPPRRELSYHTLPWKVDNTYRTSWSTVKEWLKETADFEGGGDVLDYKYDNLTKVCIPSARLPTILTLEEKSQTSQTSALERMFIYLDNVQASGSGTLYVEVTITSGTRETVAYLDSKPVFSNRKSAWANCAANIVTYTWIVWISHAVLGYPEEITVTRPASTRGAESHFVLFNAPPSQEQSLLRSSSTGSATITAKVWFVEKQKDGTVIDGRQVEYSHITMRRTERKIGAKKHFKPDLFKRKINVISFREVEEYEEEEAVGIVEAANVNAPSN
eukprot:gene10110-10990_t